MPNGVVLKLNMFERGFCGRLVCPSIDFLCHKATQTHGKRMFSRSITLLLYLYINIRPYLDPPAELFMLTKIAFS